MAKNNGPQKDKGKSKKLAKRYAERQEILKQNAQKPSQGSKPIPEPLIVDTATQQPKSVHRAKFPDNPPFWGRLMIGGNHPTVVVEEKLTWDKQKKKEVEGFVHRELTHSTKISGTPIMNPDIKDKRPVKLQKPKDIPQRLVKPLDKDWEIPQEILKPPEKK